MYGTYISHFHQASSFLLSKLFSESKKKKTLPPQKGCIPNASLFYFNL